MGSRENRHVGSRPTQTNNEVPDAPKPISQTGTANSSEAIPMPFAANDHIIPVGDVAGLIAALALKGAKPRI
jgi:hypothetical protein